VDIGEPHIASAETEGESFVFEAEQMQDGRVQIVNVHHVIEREEPYVMPGFTPAPANHMVNPNGL
jgi:hypothetical protein